MYTQPARAASAKSSVWLHNHLCTGLCIPVLKTSLGVCVHTCLLTPATPSKVGLMFLYVMNSDTEKHCST